MMKKVISFLMILAQLSVSAAFADDSNSMKEDGFSTSYSYNYDYWGDVQMAPDPYRVEAVIDSATLGLENLENTRIAKPEGIFVRNSDIYVADTGNNRILQIRYQNGQAVLKRIIKEIQGADPATFKTPMDIYVDEEDNIYIADQDNNRVLMADKDLNRRGCGRTRVRAGNQREQGFHEVRE